MDTTDCEECCHGSADQENGDKQAQSDVAKQVAADHHKDCTDSSVRLVQSEAPHHQDGEWIEVEKRRVKK